MRLTLLVVFLALLPAIAAGQELPSGFSTGPVIEAYGPVADVPGAAALPPDAVFRVAFDTAAAAEAGQLNRTLVSAARFLNMHARAGIDPSNLHVAVVIHGGAGLDVAQHANEESNLNEALIAELLQHNVEIHVCGQSAAYHGVTSDDLLPGVGMSLSAMTAHAQLQQSGFTLNPF